MMKNSRPLASLLARPPGRSLPPQSRRIPSTPTCSRWLTCSCCRKAQSGAFFTSHSPDTPSLQPQLEPDRPSKPPALPLPPRLPYSPTSLPFKRHLDALSRSLLAGPDESWGVYQALHEDLHRYVPDDIFRRVLVHQMQAEEAGERWERLHALLQLAASCGVDYRSYGQQMVELALDTALEVYVGNVGMAGGAEADLPVMVALWNALDLARVDTHIHRDWIRLVRMYHRHLVDSGRDLAQSPLPPLHTLQGLVEANATQGLARPLAHLVRLASLYNSDSAFAAYSLAVRCLHRGIDIPDRALTACIDVIDVIKNDDRDMTSPLVDLPVDLRDDLLELIERRVQLGQTPAKRTQYLLDKGEELGHALTIRHMRGVFKQDLTAEDLRRLVQIRHRIPSDIGANIHDLIIFAATKIGAGAIPDLIPDIALFPTTTARARNAQLDLLLTSDVDVYRSARELYRVARKSYQWTDRYTAWQRLFGDALSNHQTQFAARLYNDLIADGVTPTRADALRVVRSLCAARNASRPVHLERHIRDFIEFYPLHTSELVDTLVAGLADRSSDDALLGYVLARRLSTEPISGPNALKLVVTLSRSAQRPHRTTMLEIISSAELSKELPAMYEVALMSLAAGSRTHPELTRGSTRLSSAEALAACVSLHRTMAARNVRVTPRAVEAVILAAIQAGELDSALKLLGRGQRIGANTIGRMMIALSLADRPDEALEVEKGWRERQPTSWVLPVVGANVVARVVRGEVFDLDVALRREGYKPTTPFMRFVRGLQEKHAVAKVGDEVPLGESGSAAKERVEKEVGVDERRVEDLVSDLERGDEREEDERGKVRAVAAL